MSKEQRTVKPSSSSSYSGSSSSLVSNGPTGASFSASNFARGSCLGVRFVATHYWTPKWKKFIPFFPSVRCPVPCFPAKSDHISSRGSSSKGPKSAQELTFLVALWPVTPQPDPIYRPDASALLGYGLRSYNGLCFLMHTPLPLFLSSVLSWCMLVHCGAMTLW